MDGRIHTLDHSEHEHVYGSLFGILLSYEHTRLLSLLLSPQLAVVILSVALAPLYSSPSILCYAASHYTFNVLPYLWSDIP